MNIDGWLQLQAANGLSIPYVGYIELDLQLCRKVIPHVGVLVVKDSIDSCTQNY